MRDRKEVLLVIVIVFLAALWACPALAQVSGPCANCHTMHNSQDSNSVAGGDEIQRLSLTKTDCVGCHSSASGDVWKDPVTGAPIVYNTSEPTYGADAGDGKKQGLAGGNFYWVDQDDTFGHNIFTTDSNLEYAPGRIYGACSHYISCHNNLSNEYPVATGSTFVGCTKCHMIKHTTAPGSMFTSWYHHRNDNAVVIDHYSEGYYRFLESPHRNIGVFGIEDDDWEYTASSGDHNEYLGVLGDKTSAHAFSVQGTTATAFCCGCHGGMHVQNEAADGSGDWFRHPSDQTLPATGEYAGYTTYDPLVPVARPALTAVSSTVTPGTDMVMCLSCHRAHASPYPDMLRFPYSGMQAGGGGLDGVGCFKCHTNKDGT